MNKEEIKEQLREICTAANSLAGALSSLTVRLSADIMLDDEATHHCGQDTAECQPEGYTYKDLLGREVIGISGMASTCAHCSDNVDCVKVELVGGTYMCLAKPEQGKPNVINFDEEGSNVIDDIKEMAEDFLNYLDSISNTKEQ